MNSTRSSKILLFGVPLLVVIVVFFLAYSPTAIDWTLSFSKKDTKPFGSKLLFDLLPELITNNDINTSHSSIRNYFDEEKTENTNLIIINKSFKAENADFNKIYELAENGNHVFIAAQAFPKYLADTLKIGILESLNFNQFKNDSISFNLANRKLQTKLGYWYYKGITNNYFTSYDTTRTTVLGINNSGKTNFIRVKQGNGYLYLNLNPQAFTNYNLLINDNYEYAFKCLSYLPDQRTIWDEHYKIKYKAQSSIGFILDNIPLRIAWYILLAGTLIFLIFESARRQRTVPVIKPHTNSTISFVETVGRLYFSRKNHLDIAKKRFSYLLEFIRTNYFINTSVINYDMYQQLASKSSVPEKSIKDLFELGKSLNNVQNISEEDLEQFNHRIEYFYDKCK